MSIETPSAAALIEMSTFNAYYRGDLAGFELQQFKEKLDLRVHQLIEAIVKADLECDISIPWDYSNQRLNCGRGFFDPTWYRNTIGVVLSPNAEHRLLLSTSPARHIPTRYLFDQTAFEQDLKALIAKRKECVAFAREEGNPDAEALEALEEALDNLQL